MNLILKIIRYLEECIFCAKIGLKIEDKIILIKATLGFHWDKKKRSIPKIIKTQIRLGNIEPKIQIRDNCGDMFIFHEVLKDKIYRIKSGILNSSPKTIFDFGANIGLTSLVFAAQFPKAKIIAVEPNPDSAEILKNNVACLGKKIHVWEAAVSSFKGTAKLNLAAEAYNSSLVRQTAKSVEVQVVRVSDILTAEKINCIDILKIDIEGAEQMLLAGSPKWLNQCELILIELHNKYGIPEFRKDVSPAGFEVFPVGKMQAIAKRRQLKK